MEQKETQKLKDKLLLNGVLLLAASSSVTAAVGQQGRVIGATDSSGLDRTVLPIEFLSRL
jgi:hypothetical protein